MRKLTLEERIARLERIISRKNETRSKYYAQHYVDPEDIRRATPDNSVYDAVEELIKSGVPEDELVERLSEDYGFELGNDYSRAGLRQAIIRAEMHTRRR